MNLDFLNAISHSKKKRQLSQHLQKVLKMSLPLIITWKIQLLPLSYQIGMYNLYVLTMLSMKIITGGTHIVGDCVHLRQSSEEQLGYVK